MPRPGHGLSCARAPHARPETCCSACCRPLSLSLPGSSPEPLPDRRLDDFDRDRTQGDGCFDRANRPSVLETRRRPLLRHRLRALNQGADWLVPIDEVANGDDVDPLFGAGADHRNVDRLDQSRGCAVLDGDDGQSAVNTGIDAQDPAWRASRCLARIARLTAVAALIASGKTPSAFSVLAECLGAARAAVHALTRHNSSPWPLRSGSGFNPVSYGKFGSVERTRKLSGHPAVGCITPPLDRRRLICRSRLARRNQ